MKRKMLIVLSVIGVLVIGGLAWWKLPGCSSAEAAPTGQEASPAEQEADSGALVDSSEQLPDEEELPSDDSIVQLEPEVDYPALICVDGMLYRDSGVISDDLRCGMMDGQITSVVSGEPTENDQSNFGQGYGYQYWIGGEIHVNIDGQWHIFVLLEKPDDADWDSLTEPEKMERDPMNMRNE